MVVLARTFHRASKIPRLVIITRRQVSSEYYAQSRTSSEPQNAPGGSHGNKQAAQQLQRPPRGRVGAPVAWGRSHTLAYRRDFQKIEATFARKEKFVSQRNTSTCFERNGKTKSSNLEYSAGTGVMTVKQSVRRCCPMVTLTERKHRKKPRTLSTHTFALSLAPSAVHVHSLCCAHTSPSGASSGSTCFPFLASMPCMAR